MLIFINLTHYNAAVRKIACQPHGCKCYGVFSGGTCWLLNGEGTRRGLSICVGRSGRGGRWLSPARYGMFSAGFYRLNFKSPSLIQPALLQNMPKIGVSTAGRMKQTRRIPSHIFAPAFSCIAV